VVLHHLPRIARRLGVPDCHVEDVLSVGVALVRESPSIVPDILSRDIYLVLEDFCRMGCSWRKTLDSNRCAPPTSAELGLVEGKSISRRR
jgi:hypothetical protein